MMGRARFLSNIWQVASKGRLLLLLAEKQDNNISQKSQISPYTALREDIFPEESTLHIRSSTCLTRQALGVVEVIVG